jgi:hypothetical protein
MDSRTCTLPEYHALTYHTVPQAAHELWNASIASPVTSVQSGNHVPMSTHKEALGNLQQHLELCSLPGETVGSYCCHMLGAHSV